MTHKPVSQRLNEDLTKLIDNTQPGTRLPSEPDLSKQLGVSRATLREAMRTFETQGKIRRRQGSGTYVTQQPHVIEAGLEVLESINSLAENIGLPVKVGPLRTEQRPASAEESQALEISEGEQVICITRVIVAEDRPVAYLVDTLPLDILSPDELEPDFNGSVLDLLLARGTPPLLVSRTDINAAQASKQIAQAMDIQRRAVLLFFTAKLYSTAGKVVDYSRSYFLPGYFRFHVVRRIGE